MGTGEAMKDPQSDEGERRKRSTDTEKLTPEQNSIMRDDAKSVVLRKKRSFHPKFLSSEMIETLTGTVLRSKRQTDGQQSFAGASGGNTGGNSNSNLDRMKQLFNSLVEKVKQVVAAISEQFRGGQQSGAQSSNAETFQ